MIILEGCDCTGKSTLAEKLSVKYEAPITHYSRHEPEEMTNHIKVSAPGTGEIADRFCMSEIPYSMYFRHIIPDYDSVRDIDLLIRAGNNLQIICVPPWPIVKELWEARRSDELVQSLQSLHGIYTWYQDKSHAFSSSQLWKYDYTVTSFDNLCEQIDVWREDNE